MCLYRQIARLFCSWWSFFVKRIVTVWNSLPDSIVMSNSVVAFRQKLKQLHFSDFCNTGILEIHIVVYIVIIAFMLIL